MQVEMTEEEYALFKKLKIESDTKKRELEENRARAKQFNSMLEKRLSKYGVEKYQMKTACQYVRGVVKLRTTLGTSKLNASRGITERDYNLMVEMLDNVLPEIPF